MAGYAEQAGPIAELIRALLRGGADGGEAVGVVPELDTDAPTNYANFGSVTKASVKATPGNVYSVRVTNVNAAVRYFQLHDKASAPAGSDAALRSWAIPAGTAAQPAIVLLDLWYFAFSVKFALGIGWAISTVAATFTDSATAAEHNVELAYL